MTPLERAGQAALSAIRDVLDDDIDLSPHAQALVARAVLLAIREPNEAMVEAGREFDPDNSTDLDKLDELWAWQAMIDVAIGEER